MKKLDTWFGDSNKLINELLVWRNLIYLFAFFCVRLLSRPDFNRVEDAGLIVSDAGEDYTDAIIATRNQKGTYAMVYLPNPNR